MVGSLNKLMILENSPPSVFPPAEISDGVRLRVDKSGNDDDDDDEGKDVADVKPFELPLTDEATEEVLLFRF